MAADANAAQAPSWLIRVLVGRNPKRTLVRVVIIVAVCCLLRAFVLLPVQINGTSMLPTYKDHGFNIVNRLSYLFHEPRRGDVVAIRLQAGGHVIYMKRIVGLPSETVAFHKGRLCINGRPLEEPYVKLPCNWEHEPMPVGHDQYYVVGDNRDMPWLDHEQGRMSREFIVGKPLL